MCQSKPEITQIKNNILLTNFFFNLILPDSLKLGLENSPPIRFEALGCGFFFNGHNNSDF